MEEIRRSVATAQRRLNLQQFLAIVPWALFATLLVAVIGLAVPKVWAVPVQRPVWEAAWLTGAAVVGLLVAVAWTYHARRGRLDAAIEVDARFGLKERVSSALALRPEERETDAGRALLLDAERRVGDLNVKDQFAIRAGWRTLLPVVPALLAFLIIVLLPDAGARKAAAAARVEQAATEQIRRSTENLKNRLLKKKEQLDQTELKESDDLFQKLSQGLDDLSKDGQLDKQQALVKINDLAKSLAAKKQELGAPDQLQKQLEHLKNLEQGPAEKVAKALKEGDFGKAMEELRNLKQQIEQGELDAESKEKLAKQLEQMEQGLRERREERERAKEDLKRRIQDLKEQGDTAGAEQLQRQLDELEAGDQEMNRLERMANQLGRAAQSLKSGDNKQAASQLEQLAADLDDLQSEMEQLETLDELMDELADAKNAMNCKQCEGGG